jgi:small conductance mechanosensitive channel
VEQEIQQFTAIYQTIVSFIITYSFQILGAGVILLLGIFVARKVSNLVVNLLLRHKLDSTLSNFIASFVRIAIIVMVAIMALNKVGISVTPLLATVGALSLGAGLAVQGLVSNYGAGLNIIVARPFVVGDTIEVHGVKGVVKEVHLGFTILSDEDNVEIMVPNRHVVGEIIKNSQLDTLIEVNIGVSYADGPEKAITVIKQVLKDATPLSKERPFQVGVNDFGPSSINIGIRMWAPTQTHYAARFAVNQAIYAALIQANVSIPFPQRDVHLYPKE